MKKLKEYKYLVLIVILIFGIGFYWFQVRPAQARKECIKAYPYAFNLPNDNRGEGLLQTAREWKGSRDKADYEKCLREHGLNK